jgi:hypothetical protein
MKTSFFLTMLLIFSGIISAQDTIYIKSGGRIPAVIISKSNMEIKYKKFGQPEPAAIYSVFVSDISSIHYNDGIVADYTSTGQNEIDNRPKTNVEKAGTMEAIRFNIGMSVSHFSRTTSDNLTKFWQYYNGTNSQKIGGNAVSYPIDLKMSFVLGRSGRNLIGDELQLIITPKDAIYATNSDRSNEIQLHSFYYNIIMFYGHTLNHKKNLIAIFEPGLNLAFMSGYIKLNNTKYDISGNLGSGLHLALGADWVISRRLLASFRAGERYMTVKESHKKSATSTDYVTFYVNKTVNDDLLSVKWSGPFVSAGLSWSLYAKMNTGRSK